MTRERWRAIEEGEGRWEISDHGRMRAAYGYGFGKAYMEEHQIIRPNTNRGGYVFTNKIYNKNKFTLYYHRIVAREFIGPCPKEMTVNHRDGNKLNNHLHNLEYVSQSLNIQHANLNILRKYDATPALVRSIRTAYAAGHSVRELASEFHNLSYEIIYRIVTRQTWFYVA